jgi:ribosomal-protein-alanine N-acetyltransferase
MNPVTIYHICKGSDLMSISKEQLINIPTYDLGDLVLRPIQITDYLDMFEYGSDDEVTKMLTWNSFTDPSEAKKAIEHIFLTRPTRNIPNAHAIIHKATNKMIGTCDFPSVDWDKKTATLGYCMNRRYWGKGYMTRVVRQIIHFAFDDLQLDAIHVQHHPDNIGSKKVILKNNFRYLDDQYNQSLGLSLPTYLLKKEEV